MYKKKSRNVHNIFITSKNKQKLHQYRHNNNANTQIVFFLRAISRVPIDNKYIKKNPCPLVSWSSKKSMLFINSLLFINFIIS